MQQDSLDRARCVISGGSLDKSAIAASLRQLNLVGRCLAFRRVLAQVRQPAGSTIQLAGSTPAFKLTAS